MKNLIATLLALSSLSAFAQSVPATSKTEIVVPSKKVDSVLTQSNGYVSAFEISENLVKVPGTKVENGNIIIDLRNPRLDVTDIILNNGTVRDVRKVEGGDMGGGGARIIRQ